VVKTNPNDGLSCLSRYHLSIVGGRSCSFHLRALEGIKDELHALSERSSAVGYQENGTDGHAVCELAEDIRDAIIEYQVSSGPPVTRRILCSGTVQFTQQKSLYEKNCRLIVCPCCFVSPCT